MKFCYNCQAGLHGQCSMSWCACPLPDCRIGYKPVFIIEEVFDYISTKSPKSLKVTKVAVSGPEKEKLKV